MVQSALGAIVALCTSTLNRVMAVELALPLMIPGALVALHYAVQLTRPRWGYGSDVGNRRTPWIIGGMGVLCLGGLGATDATLMMPSSPLMGTIIAAISYVLTFGLYGNPCRARTSRRRGVNYVGHDGDWDRYFLGRRG
jgi:MFS transporter, BCD family, chlorophyll transporter